METAAKPNMVLPPGEQHGVGGGLQSLTAFLVVVVVVVVIVVVVAVLLLILLLLLVQGGLVAQSLGCWIHDQKVAS